jgi:hypothetical protein
MIDLRKILRDRAARDIGTDGGIFGTTNTEGQPTGLLDGLQNINPNLLIGAAITGSGFQGKDPFSSILPAFTQAAQISKYLTPKVSKPSTYINKETGQPELVTPQKYAANPDLYAPLPPTKMFESAEEKKRGELFGTELIDINKGSDTAFKNNQNLDLMNELVNLPNIKTGFAGELRTNVAAVAKEFGIDTDIQDLTAAEALKGVSGKVVLDGLSAFKGAISDGERKFLVSITPGLTNTIEGNKLLIQIGKRQNQLAIGLAEEANKWSNENGGLSKKNTQGLSWGQFKSEWQKNNPVLKPELKKSILELSKKIESDFENNVITKDGKKYIKIGGEWRLID